MSERGRRLLLIPYALFVYPECTGRELGERSEPWHSQTLPLTVCGYGSHAYSTLLTRCLVYLRPIMVLGRTGWSVRESTSNGNGWYNSEAEDDDQDQDQDQDDQGQDQDVDQAAQSQAEENRSVSRASSTIHLSTQGTHSIHVHQCDYTFLDDLLP